MLQGSETRFEILDLGQTGPCSIVVQIKHIVWTLLSQKSAIFVWPRNVTEIPLPRPKNIPHLQLFAVRKVACVLQSKFVCTRNVLFLLVKETSGQQTVTFLVQMESYGNAIRPAPVNKQKRNCPASANFTAVNFVVRG